MVERGNGVGTWGEFQASGMDVECGHTLSPYLFVMT